MSQKKKPQKDMMCCCLKYGFSVCIRSSCNDYKNGCMSYRAKLAQLYTHYFLLKIFKFVTFDTYELDTVLYA